MIHRTYRGLVKIGGLAIRRLLVVLRRMVRYVTGRGIPFAVRIIKKWGKVSHRCYKAYIAPVIHKIIRGAKCAYGHTILALHAKLSLWWHWYAHWHHTRLHRIVHWSVASVGLLLVLTLATMLQVATNALSDLTDTWNFATPSDYTADSGVEVVGGVARLKAQNYTADANTSALYHFDEANGTTAADGSTNNNPMTISGATFGAGNLNNALNFNGTTDKASAPDTTANSFTQKNTIEAWTKLTVPFSAGAAQKQTVIDKGDYKLYYDNATGKVTYELANTGTVTWASIGSHASFVANEPSYMYVYASAVYNNEKYYGLGSYNYGDADVWKYNGTTWTQIGGDGLNGSWSSATGSYYNVLTLVVYNNDLYASIYGGTLFTNEIWKYNGTTWTQIGGDGLNGSWSGGNRQQTRSMVVYGSSLYATVGYGFSNGTSQADANEVWRWDGTAWVKVGGGGVNGSWNIARAYHGTGILFATANKLYYGSSVYDSYYYTAEVWSYDGTTWTKIGGNSWGSNGVNGSWNASAVHTSYFSEVSSIGGDGSNIYIALWGNGQSAYDGGVDVWKWDGTTWTRIGGGGLNGGWNAYAYSSAPQLKWDGTSLYVGISSVSDSGIPSVWKLTNGTWSKWVGYTQLGYATSINDITFDGNDTYVSLGRGYAYGAAAVWKNNGSSWTRIGGDGYGNSWRVTAGYAIRTTTVLNGSLYAGMGMYTYAKSGDAQVYRYGGSGTTWTKIGGNGVNNSWNYDTGSYYGVSVLYAYGGNIYAGLNGAAGDAELWKWDGTTWIKIGGDGLNSSWVSGTYTGVRSIIAYNGSIYAGIGSQTNGDAELWKYDGTTWTKAGGDGVNSSWSNKYAVKSLAVYNGNLIAGIYADSGFGEAWSYNGTVWTQIGGGTGQWSIEGSAASVDALTVYGNKLYAAIGAGNADSSYGNYGSGTVWRYDGTAWARVGGRYTAGSWTDYANIDSMIVYNGQLYIAISPQYNSSQIWRYNGSTWTLVANHSMNGYNNYEYASPPSLVVYSNKLCVGIGSYSGGSEVVTCSSPGGSVQSTTTTWDTAWHHIAGTYDGETMNLYIDGVLNNSTTTALSLPDSGASLLVGNGQGGNFSGDTSTGGFNGSIDEVRLSNQARTSFTTQPYVATAQAITLAGAVRKQGVWHWDALSDTEAPHGGNITYRLSSDGGTTWQYWNGSAWATSSGLAQANPIATTTAHIADFPVTFDGIQWQAVLRGNGTQQVTLNGVGLDATSDYSAPSMAGSSITAAKTQGGAALASNAWTNSGAPSFTWSAGSDGESGIKGYCAYLGTSDTADPITTKGLLGVSPLATGDHCQFAASSAALNTAVAGIMASQLTTSNSPYYLTLRALDKAGNVSADTAQFHFRFDNTPPTAPAYITAPSGYVNTKDITMTWPISGNGSPDDANSGFAGLQYRVGATGTWYGDSHTGTGDITDLLTNDGSYRTSEDPDYPHLSEGVNTVYFRAWDNAGNVSVANATAALKINTMGAPSEPQSITATPATTLPMPLPFRGTNLVAILVMLATLATATPLILCHLPPTAPLLVRGRPVWPPAPMPLNRVLIRCTLSPKTNLTTLTTAPMIPLNLSPTPQPLVCP